MTSELTTPLSSAEEGNQSSHRPYGEGRSQTLDRLAIPLLFAFSAALYIATTRYAFVGDDPILIGSNPYVRSFHFLREIFTQSFWSFAGVRGESTYYRPLVMFSFLLQRMVFGARPAPFHLFNVFLNSWVVAMVYQLGKRFWPIGQGAFWGALLFAALPVHSEDVATVSGISDLECAAFFLAAMLIYVQPAGTKGFSRLRAWMSALVFLLAALCKEVALVLPPLMVIYEHFLRDDAEAGFLQRLSRYLPSFVLAAFYVVVHLAVIGGVSDLSLSSIMRLRETAIFSSTQLGEYVGKLIWPQHLSYSWKFHPPISWRDPAILMGMLFAIWAAGVVVAGWLRDRHISFAILWFLFTLAPVLNFAGVGVAAYGERYLYIPSVGICWLAGQALCAMGTRARAAPTPAEESRPSGEKQWFRAGASRRIVALVISSAVVLAASVRTLMRLPAWRDNFNLGLATVREDPNAGRFYIFMGNEYRTQGKRDLARINYLSGTATDEHAAEGFVNLAAVVLDDGNTAAAEDILRRGSQLNPTYSKLPFALGLIAAHRGSKEEASDLFSRALSLDPNDYEALFQLGLLSLQEGHFEQAESLLARDAMVQPASAPVHLNLGAVYSHEHKFSAAEAEFRRAIQLAPDDEAPYLSLAGVYEDQGKQAEALELYRQIVRSAPNSGNGQFRLGVLALKLGRTDEAIAALEKAVRVQPKSALAHAQLGLAYLESGKCGDAPREIEEAKTLDPQNETVQMALRKLAKDR